jgi:ribosomal protein S12 methylthiotransferase accessory factor
MELSDLINPYIGMFSSCRLQHSMIDEPGVTVAGVRARRVVEFNGTVSSDLLLGGSGTALDREGAEFRAVAEGLERHCAAQVSAATVLWASERELGSEAISLSTFPACSDRELADEKCPLRRSDPYARIRWVRGVSLDGDIRYLPLVSVYITKPMVDAERFLLGISTGCAAHSSLESAILSGALEVLERDATSITWLQQLPLPRIYFDQPQQIFGPLWPELEQCSSALSYTFFDATSEFRIPIVYGLRTSKWNEKLHVLVACSASFDAAAACRKTMLELSSFGIWLRPNRPVPANVQDFTALHHGPTWMARKERAEAFSFLLNSGNNVSITQVQERSLAEANDDTHVKLRKLSARLRIAGLTAYVVDIGTEESRRAGLRVVRVVIPGLMPLSWVQRARYLGHPRLYEAPAKLGYSVKQESDLNPWPQPFG